MHMLVPSLKVYPYHLCGGGAVVLRARVVLDLVPRRWSPASRAEAGRAARDWALGCEPANFGLCRYPASITLGGRRVATHVDGWSWRSFCKTQYASDPQCGGVENFLRCHLSIVKLLDFAAKTGLAQVEVKDEGGYWQERDLKKLAETVGEWNEMIAAMVGQFTDAAKALGASSEAAISGFQTFEHLEAKGLKRLKRLRQADSDD